MKLSNGEGKTKNMMEHYGVALLIVSIVMLVGSVLAVPFLVARLPVDYFRNERRRRMFDAGGSGPLHWVVLIGKNAIGLVLILLGLIMLVTPGQGLLTLLAGFVLMDFPGKFQVERRIAGMPGVMKGINWVRRRRGKEPLEGPRADDPSPYTR